MLHEVRDVETVARHHVTFSERIVLTGDRRIDPLVDVDAHLARDVFQAGIALAMDFRLDVPGDLEPAIRGAHLEVHGYGPREIKTLERLERHNVVNQDALPASGQQTADINFVRLNHSHRNISGPRQGAPLGLGHCRAPQGACQTEVSEGWTDAMNVLSSADLAARGVAYAPEIASAAARNRLDPTLLAAVAAQETGGPDTNAGANIVGDGGHGHGVFQIDDRWHAFAQTSDAMKPAANAQYAAHMLRGLLDENGGDIRAALSSYNAGDPHARGTTTRWGDGRVLGYADSVLRHYRRISGGAGGTPPSSPGKTTGPASCPVPDPGSLLSEAIAEGPFTLGSVNALSDYHHRSYRDLAPPSDGDPFAGMLGDDQTSD